MCHPIPDPDPTTADVVAVWRRHGGQAFTYQPQPTPLAYDHLDASERAWLAAARRSARNRSLGLAAAATLAVATIVVLVLRRRGPVS
jgi:hypothetical protein